MKKTLLFAVLTVCFYTCSDSQLVHETDNSFTSRNQLQLSLKQAAAYASLFYEGMFINLSHYEYR